MPRLWIFSDLHQDHAGNAWAPGAHAPRDGFDSRSWPAIYIRR